MLRPTFAALSIIVAAALVAPTVADVSRAVEALDIKRELPWRLWKWDTHVAPRPPGPRDCDPVPRDTASEITEWPTRVAKDEPLFIAGRVYATGDAGRRLAGVRVDVFLNESKDSPGTLLGTVPTTAGGRFELHATFPFEKKAAHYHLVAHSFEKIDGCNKYRESWSDPELDVTAETSLELLLPDNAVVGRETTVAGVLLDHVGAPVPDARVKVLIARRWTDVQTDGAGRFTLEHTPTKPGALELRAEFAGTPHYGAARAHGSFEVGDEFAELLHTEGGFEVERSRTAILEARILVPPAREGAPAFFAFDGLRVATCPECPPTARVEAKVTADGTHRADVFIPASQPPGPFTVTIEGGGLTTSVREDGVLVVPTSVQLEAHGTGPFARTLAGSARVLDDRGEPVAMPLAVTAGGSWLSLSANGQSPAPFSMNSACGPQEVRALYNGSATHRPSIGVAEADVCPLLALFPPFLLAVPWWVWPAALAAIAASVLALRRYQERRAPTLSRGPPVELRLVRPDDEAAGIVAPGEVAEFEARLAQPLPSGYAMRFGARGQLAPLEPEGPERVAAMATFASQETGDVLLAVEILNARGRVVTRRTQPLRVARYGEEIERRYRKLKRGRVGKGAELVSPREFEAWLLARNEGVDRAVAARLVGIFEEADYGPRDVGRRELAAYLRAERAMPRDAVRPGVRDPAPQ